MNANPESAQRHFPADMDPNVVEQIDVRLSYIEAQHRVAIGFAVESGSRAWGFPSPDSDYDCRFVFVRPSADYLRLLAKRDVIEAPMTSVLDVNGWDIGKALRLLLAGNAVIIEWLTSPITYRGDEAFKADFIRLAGALADRKRIMRHYLHLGRRTLKDNLPDLDDVVIKKLLYALRPAVALRWLRLHPEERLPPMNFVSLCADADLAPDLKSCIGELLARKAVTREMGRGPMPALLRQVIADEFDITDRLFETHTEAGPSPDDMDRADTFFRKWIAFFDEERSALKTP